MVAIAFSKLLEQVNKLNAKNTEFFFWGASNFLQDFLTNTRLIGYSVKGIIDSDKSKHNSFFCGLTVYSPQVLKDLKNKDTHIVFAIQNNHEKVYQDILEFLKENHLLDSVTLLPDVFPTYKFASYSQNEKDNFFAKYKDLSNKFGVTLLEAQNEDIALYNKILSDDLIKASEMSHQDRLFLIALLNKFKPQKILEIGVSQGGSSSVILNTIQNTRAKLYSIDLATQNYRDNTKKTGCFVDNDPKLKENWTLLTGNIVCAFLDNIASTVDDSEKFDFCLIDTMHAYPGEILDTIQVLPYMKKDSIICYHDINFQYGHNGTRCYRTTNNSVFSTLQGKKFVPAPTPYAGILNSLFIPNIGAIQLSDIDTQVYSLFNLLNHKWQYSIYKEHIDMLSNFVGYIYSPYFRDYFKEVITMQNTIF